MKHFYYVAYTYLDEKGRRQISCVEFNSGLPIASIDDVNQIAARLAGLEKHAAHSAICIQSYQLLRVVGIPELARIAQLESELSSAQRRVAGASELADLMSGEKSAAVKKYGRTIKEFLFA